MDEIDNVSKAYTKKQNFIKNNIKKKCNNYEDAIEKFGLVFFWNDFFKEEKFNALNEEANIIKNNCDKLNRKFFFCSLASFVTFDYLQNYRFRIFRLSYTPTLGKILIKFYFIPSLVSRILGSSMMIAENKKFIEKYNLLENEDIKVWYNSDDM